MTSPKPGDDEPRPRRSARWRWALGAALLLAALGASLTPLLTTDSDTDAEPAERTTGLPDTPDYHSLLVAPDDPERVILGTHHGLFESTDAGRTWRATETLEGDAMSLARATRPATVYAAGHELFKRSTDGGETWRDVPLDDAIAQTRAIDGSKGVDIHGFAASPADADTLYAAVANVGLFRSTDGADTFDKLSDTGAAAMGVAVAPTDPQRIYLADARRGLLLSTDEGRTWRELGIQALSVAVDPRSPDRVLAGGPGLYLSTDGTSFERVEASDDGFGPVVFAPSDPQQAYAIALDGTLLVSDDGGVTWQTR